MKIQFRSLILAFSLTVCAAGAAFAAGGGGGDSMSTPAKAADPTLERAQAAIAQQDWAGAQSVLRDAVARNPQNADYHNLYAYSIRKGANPDMSLVFKHYNEALSIDPKHKGAHEYLGEAYLMVGNVGKAKEHLAQLDKICFFSCSEFTDLKRAVSEFETKQVAR
jgi:Tfp pilus assembly protein PilF